MTRALVFGKFLPFHNGHAALLRFALTQADSVTALVCASDREAIPGAQRARWIRATFAGEARLQVQVYEYSEADLVNSSVADEAVAQQWAEVFRTVVPGHDLVVTSEPYGPMVARALGIAYRAFDPGRTQVPVSGTALRTDLAAHWQHLPDPVRADLALRVVILGTESTGKSTLTADLAAHFNGTLVTEAGRDLIADSNDFVYADLLRVAEAHAQRVAAAARGPRPLLFIDTDLHITRSYARFVFGRELEVSAAIEAESRADLRLYLDAAVPFVQDGTRLHEGHRNRLDASHRAVLAERKLPFTELRGTWEARRVGAIVAVEELLSLPRW
ncbi:AAA family ATPase [Flaviaesturariibacter amylovorans]|uniref:Nicotinamide-nucleotide adenylyltransferase n=1 Tax=Flaviaesturariibacter amylovorans TaxID=1084520 RepID=A0ABP8GAD1_9BACT